jgi:hypothetical protein
MILSGFILHYKRRGAIVTPPAYKFPAFLFHDLPIQITPSGDDTRFFTIYSKAIIGQEV